MLGLDENWKPEWGGIVTWFGMDKKGQIAMLVNNCWGDVPKVILRQASVEEKLGCLQDFVYEESSIYTDYPIDKNGDFYLDLFSAWTSRVKTSDIEVINSKRENIIKNLEHYYSEQSLANKKILLI